MKKTDFLQLCSSCYTGRYAVETKWVEVDAWKYRKLKEKQNQKDTESRAKINKKEKKMREQTEY